MPCLSAEKKQFRFGIHQSEALYKTRRAGSHLRKAIKGRGIMPQILMGRQRFPPAPPLNDINRYALGIQGRCSPGSQAMSINTCIMDPIGQGGNLHYSRDAFPQSFPKHASLFSFPSLKAIRFQVMKVATWHNTLSTSISGRNIPSLKTSVLDCFIRMERYFLSSCVSTEISSHLRASISEMRNRKKNPKIQAVYSSQCIDSMPVFRVAFLQTNSLCIQRSRSVLKGCFRVTPSFFFRPFIIALARWAWAVKSTLPLIKCMNLIAAKRLFRVEDSPPRTLLVQIRKSNNGSSHPGVPGVSHAEIPLAKTKPSPP